MGKNSKIMTAECIDELNTTYRGGKPIHNRCYIFTETFSVCGTGF